MISSDMVEVSVTYGSKITFFLRLIGIAEEEKLRQKTFGLTDAEKAEKEYKNNVDLLVELSVKMPAGLFPERPKVCDASLEDPSVYIDSFKTPGEAVKAFFAEKTPLKERIAFYGVRGYFLRIQPSDFF